LSFDPENRKKITDAGGVELLKSIASADDDENVRKNAKGALFLFGIKDEAV
jgi:hypothetical protein